MNNEGPYDPRQDEEYQQFLIQKSAKQYEQHQYPQEQNRQQTRTTTLTNRQQQTAPAPQVRTSNNYSAAPTRAATAQSIAPPTRQPEPIREFVPEKTEPKWDKTVQRGEVFGTLQRSYENKSGKWYNGQLRLVIQTYKNNQYVAIENWKPIDDDIKHEPNAQQHIWKGSCNVQLREIRILATMLMELANHLDGGLSG